MSTIQLINQYTGETVDFIETITTYNGNPITDSICDDIIYIKHNNLYYKRYIEDYINVRWFGATGDGVTDDTTAIQKACNVGRNIYFPKGEYSFNAEIEYKVRIFGTNSHSTILKPFNVDIPIIILSKNKDPFWQYATVFEGLTFEGSNKTGCGISLGKGNASEYKNEDEYNTNITFRNVDFKQLDKGIQCLFGNIGMDFYSVGIHDNKYGMYFLDNKFGDPTRIMHAGNRYFYSGEISGNEIGIYIHNSTEGFGGIVFNNVIFEHNHINTYINTNNTIIPIAFNSCWNEGSGQILNSSNKITIDTWIGDTKGKKEIDAHSHIFEGENLACNVYNSFISDYYIDGKNITVKAIDCTVESNPGVGAASSIVKGNNCSLLLHRPITIFGIPKGDNIFVVDNYDYSRQLYIDNNASTSTIRSAIGTARFNKAENIQNKVLSLPLESIDILTGSLSSVSGAIVNDSIIFNESNQFNIPFNGGNQYMGLASSTVNISSNNTSGWYVVTFDMKINSGDPTLFLWNRNQYQVMQYTPTVKNKWQTVLCYACSNPNDPNLEFFLDISALSNVDIQLSAYQVLKFDTKIEAKSFIESKIYAL